MIWHFNSPYQLTHQFKSMTCRWALCILLSHQWIQASSCQIASFGPSPSTVRMRAKFFNSVDQSSPTVSIPTEWMNFFTLLLVKDSSFDWAKKFLHSPTWSIISKALTDENSGVNLPDPSALSAAMNKNSEAIQLEPDKCLTPPPMPPVVSPPARSKRVRELGSSFCNISPDDLTDENLLVNSEKGKSIEKPTNKRSKKSEAIKVPSS